jgi:hypothetical protein
MLGVTEENYDVVITVHRFQLMNTKKGHTSYITIRTSVEHFWCFADYVHKRHWIPDGHKLYKRHVSMDFLILRGVIEMEKDISYMTLKEHQ